MLDGHDRRPAVPRDRAHAGRPHAGMMKPAPREATPVNEKWWRWGRIELPVQNTFPENFLQVFPAYLRFAVRAPDRRGASLAIR